MSAAPARMWSKLRQRFCSFWHRNRFYSIPPIVTFAVIVFAAMSNDWRAQPSAQTVISDLPANNQRILPTQQQLATELYDNGEGWYNGGDYKLARFWYLKAAAAGSPEAMTSLGVLCQLGRGVTRDYRRARFWYQKAADAGDTDAMYYLGALYNFGLGAPKDYKQARYWYEKAAAAGDRDAAYRLAVLYAHGRGVVQDYQQARYWYQKAAEGFDTDAMYHLGLFYQFGLGGTQDYAQARYWYQRAADYGDPRAEKRFQQLSK